MNLLPILSKAGVVEDAQVSELEKEARVEGSLEKALQKRGILPEVYLKAASEHYGIPFRELAAKPVSHEALQYIPEESAKHYGLAPLSVEDNALIVGVTDPDNLEALDALQFISTRVDMPYKLFLISEKDFEKVMGEYKNLTGEVGAALSELDESLAVDLSKNKIEKEETIKEGEAIKADAPVTKIVATVLRYAVEGNASDIHIEPTPEKTRVRFRMDGDLHTSLELPLKVHSSVVARIKILSQMRLDEKRKPQD